MAAESGQCASAAMHDAVRRDDARATHGASPHQLPRMRRCVCADSRTIGRDGGGPVAGDLRLWTEL